ncbi:MAG: PTS glucitol/sorbitol transporter subunit IIA [Anaerobutyricum hallii]
MNPINGEIKAGQTLKIDENEYKITCVGEEAPGNTRRSWVIVRSALMG